MIPVHFHAEYLPNHREFRVTVKAGKIRLSEKMTISKFIRMARNAKKPLVISGQTIVFDQPESPVAEDQVRRYLRDVAQSYLAQFN